jgi:hypothetical protein
VAMNHVLKYMKGTVQYGIKYTRYYGLFLHGLCDLDWVDSANLRNITSRFCFNLGLRLIYWFSRKHIVVALSLNKQSI